MAFASVEQLASDFQRASPELLEELWVLALAVQRPSPPVQPVSAPLQPSPGGLLPVPERLVVEPGWAAEQPSM
jgi:hypothetical protein